MSSAVDILRVASQITGYSCRGLEVAVALFLTAQYLKKHSNYRSAYFIILNIGYLVDLIYLLHQLPITSNLYSVILILRTWQNTYFLTIWNVVLCLNRCTALAFPTKYDRIWSPLAMTITVLLMLTFPLIVDGYSFINFQCSETNIDACRAFRSFYYFKGAIVNCICNTLVCILIAYCMYRSKNDQIQALSSRAKAERRLIYQAILSSIFQLVFFILNYISSIVNDTNILYVYVYSANIGYYIQHYAVMVTHFVFSPSFKMAFLNFYHLNCLSRDGRVSSLAAASTKPATITAKAMVPVK